MLTRIANSPSRSLAVWTLALIAGVSVATLTGVRWAFAPMVLVGTFALIIVIPFVIKKKMTRLLIGAGLLFVAGAARSLALPLVVESKPLVIPIFQTFKNATVRSVGQTLPEPQAGFLVGLLAGGSSTLSSELRAAFAATGTAHVVALSGWNITVIANGLERALRYVRVRRRARLALSSGAVILFVIMVGAGASLVRAAIMGLLVVFAKTVGRRGSAGIAVTVAAGVMLFITPALTTDIGFLLSFAATLGIIYIAPLVEPLTRWLPEFFAFRENGTNTVAATLATLPIVLFAFGRFSWVALPTNLLLLPFVPYAMGVGFVGALVGLGSVAAGRLIGLASSVLLGYCISVVRLFARIPGASAQGISFNIVAAIIMAVGIIAVCVSTNVQNSRKS